MAAESDSYDAEKKVAGSDELVAQETTEGTINPLKRNLQGRHMQMIAIGRFPPLSFFFPPLFQILVGRDFHEKNKINEKYLDASL